MTNPAALTIVLVILTLLQPDRLSAQSPIYQVTGIVMDQASQQSIPYAHIRIRGTQKGTVSSSQGFFSLVVKGGDTLKVSSVGYRDKQIGIPDTLNDYLQTLTIVLAPDTILLDESMVYPWPNKNAFKEAFMALEVVEENQITPYAGFKRIDNPVEPEPSILNPVSLFYEKVIKKVKEKKRKRKMAAQLPKWE